MRLGPKKSRYPSRPSIRFGGEEEDPYHRWSKKQNKKQTKNKKEKEKGKESPKTGN